MKKIILLVFIWGLFVFVACDLIEELDINEPAVIAEPEINEPDEADEPEVDEAEVDEPDEADEPEVEPDAVSSFTGFEQFLTLEMGMSISEVEEIMGVPMSTTSMDLLGIETVTKIWMNINLISGSSSSTVTFSNGSVTSVLETMDDNSNLSITDYNEISTDMSEVEVYEILGAPNSVMVMELMGSTSTTVSWVNRDFSSITITFTNGAISSSSQFNLN